MAPGNAFHIDHLGAISNAHGNAPDAAGREQAQLMRQEGLAIDFDERLGNLLGDRPEARGEAARKNGDREHEIL